MTHRATMQLLLVLVAAGGALTPAPSAYAQPVLSFTGAEMTVSGVTPGCEVAYLGIARERRGWTTYRTRFAGQVVDQDLDGVISIEVPGGMPVASVWIAVELEDGETGVGAPGGSPRLAPEMLPAAVVGDAAGEAQGVRVSRELVRVFIVRPGQGSWDGSVGDGAAGDLDGTVDGGIDVDLGVMAPVEEEVPALAGLQGEDVVVVLDPRSLEIATTRVTTAQR